MFGMLLPEATTAAIVGAALLIAGFLLFGPTRAGGLPWSRLLLGMGIAVAGVGFGLFSFMTPKIVSPAPRARSKLTGDWKLASIPDKRPTSIVDFKGKILLINDWATWCGPCVEEMPSFQRLYDRFKDDKRIEFLFVSFDENIETVELFRRKSGLTMPMYVRLEEPPRVIRPSAFPTTYIIHPDGNIARMIEGAAQWDHPDVVREIESICAENAAKP